LENNEFAKFKTLTYDYFGPREIKNPRKFRLFIDEKYGRRIILTQFQNFI